MSHPRRNRRTRATALLGMGALAIGGGAVALAPTSSTASSHREAPAICNQPAYDNTDVYAFVSPTRTVTFVANWYGLRGAGRRPNFYPSATDAGTTSTSTPTTTRSRHVYTLRVPTTRTPNAADSSPATTFLYNNGPVEDR